jgi:ubiquitin-protein ligase
MSSQVRLRRLMADYTRVAEVFKDHPQIAVKKVYGNPPEKYELEYKVRSLVSRGGRIEPKDSHVVEIQLPLGYPRQAPVCRMLTPVFHPNIAPHAVCIGDHWAAGESLVHLAVRIGEMLAFQSYNIKSPLNGEAARWADEHREELPTDKTDLEPEKRPEDIPVDVEEASKTIPVARSVPVAKPVVPPAPPPPAPGVPVAMPVAPPGAGGVPRPPVMRPPTSAAAAGAGGAAGAGAAGSKVASGAARMSCKSCGRSRIVADRSSPFSQRCMYCGGEMIATWQEPSKGST